MLPNELLHAIISFKPLRATGLACCLVSRRFLPHGRRILYSHLDNRDVDGEGDFALLVARLLEYPHLADYLRTCTFRVGPNLSEDDAIVIEDVVKFCPHLDSFVLLEGEMEDDLDDGEWDDEVLYWQDLRHRILGALHPARLRRLDATSGGASGGWGSIRSLLHHSPELRSLRLFRLFKSDTREPSLGSLELDLPNLIRLSVQFCDNDVLSSLVVAAPNLLHLTWHTLDTSLKNVPLPHPTLSSLNCHLRIGANDMTSDAQLAALSTVFSSFPTLKTLELFLNLLDSPIAASAAPPSPTTATTLLSSFPPSLTSLTLVGDTSIIPFSLPFSTLLQQQKSSPRTFLPLLEDYCPVWLAPVPRTLWNPLAEACLEAGIRIRGTLAVLHGKENQRALVARMKEVRGKLLAEEERVQERWAEMGKEDRVQNGWLDDEPAARSSESWPKLFEVADSEEE
ncbi:hypothetical protein RQP46_004663 [Phenoliferia psychrophenolica]